MFRLRIKELREEKGLSQKKLADQLGLSAGTIGNWESGIREPNFDTVAKLAEFFNVTVDYLLGNSYIRNPEMATPDDDDIKFALFGGEKGISDEAYEDVKRFAAFIKDKYKKD